MKFYSEKLDKLFETEAALVEAEEIQAKEEAEKQKLKDQKKEDAKLVEESFKALNEAKTKYNRTKMEAHKEYLKKVAAAKAEYEDTISRAYEVVVEGEAAHSKNLNAFLEKHKEGFHTTIHDADGTVSISVNDNKSLNEFYEGLKDFWKDYTDIFDKFWY